MKIRILASTCIIFTFFWVNSILPTSQTGKITIYLENIQVDRPGQLIIGLFDKEKGFPDTRKAIKLYRLDISTEITANFSGLNYGEYAIVAVHDENNNGKMDMKWLPFPHPGEGFSVSNQRFSSFSPPQFQKAKILLDKNELKITLKMIY
ncbi:MAG: DUF2141 domain-containing protein [Leptospiraceae bacterium]|nr:DUF2141 domain-containing protein [Leptospiraceae bacterium]MCK6381359.1 DUF2141 domain-containing protein [Leptospiraceae bacterium]